MGDRFKRNIVRSAALACAVLAIGGGVRIAARAQAQTAELPKGGVPVFEVESTFLKVPNNWLHGRMASVFVDSRDHVWIDQRYKEGSADPSRLAPPVEEYDQNGNYIQGWGGTNSEHDWANSEHSINVDVPNNTVWLAGNGAGDNFLQKYDLKGHFIAQYFKKGVTSGNRDTHSLGQAAAIYFDRAANELYIADGYANQRVVVLDAKTGTVKRMWGAFGKEVADVPPPPPRANPRPAGPPRSFVRPEGAPESNPPKPGAGGGRSEAGIGPQEGPGPDTFGNPVHCVMIANDGLVYVCDRTNKRIQVFHKDGTFVTQVFINRSFNRTDGTASGIAFSPDKDQKFMYVSSYPGEVAIMDRKTLKVLYQIGGFGPAPGQFDLPHQISADSKGNVYIADLFNYRVDKLIYKGMSPTLPANAMTADQLAQAAP